MSKSKKILLLIATIWPVIYIPLFFVFFLTTFIFSKQPPNDPPMSVFIIIPLHFLTVLLSLGLMAFYAINIFKSGRVKKDDRVMWAILLLLGGNITMLVYWHLFIWKTTPKK